MTKYRRLFAGAALASLISVLSPTAASAQIDIPILIPEINEPIPGLDGPTLPPTPPRRVGENVQCHNGVVMGNFTDLDQDDDTLRVYGIVDADAPEILYPAVRAFGMWMFVSPYDGGTQVNLVAFDDHGFRTNHRAMLMWGDGTCVDPSGDWK